MPAPGGTHKSIDDNFGMSPTELPRSFPTIFLNLCSSSKSSKGRARHTRREERLKSRFMDLRLVQHENVSLMDNAAAVQSARVGRRCLVLKLLKIYQSLCCNGPLYF